MLNIPLLLGGREKQKQCSIPSGFPFKNQPHGLQPIFFFYVGLEATPPENMKGKTGLFGLAASWRKISFGHSVRQFSVNWSLLLWELG